MLWLLVLLFTGSTLTHHHHHGHHHGHHFLDALSSVVSQISHRQGPETTTERLPSSQAPPVPYGPSIVSLTKYNKDVHGPTIFHPDTGRLINLQDYPNYSVVVPLAPDSPTATSNQLFVSRRLSGPGEFVVVAPEGHGVMAVIQSLDLRTAATGCNDFIQFGDVDSGVESGTSCGKVDTADGSFSPTSLLGPRVFLSPSGSMKVLFYHGLIWGLVRDFNFDIFDPSRNPLLKVEIVFTAYKECDKANVTSPYNPHGYTYRYCTNPNTPQEKTCIPAQLFCDRVTNCAFENNFGSDEYITNCLPTLINLLLPQLRQPASPLNPGSQSASSAYLISTSAPTTTIATTPSPPPTTSEVTTTLSTTTTRSTTTSPTTTTPRATTTISTTTPPPVPSSFSTTTVTTKAPFCTQLHEHFFDLSPETVVPQIRFRPSIATPTSTTNPPLPSIVSPTAAIAQEASFRHTVQLPPEFGQAANLNLDQNQEQESNLSTTLSNPQIPQLNMTFTGSDNTLSVQEDEGQVEQLQSFSDVSTGDDIVPGVDQDASLLESGEETSLVLWIIFVFLVFLGVFCMLRLFCCRNRVVWIPNPKALRARRKRRETSVYANPNNFPEIHVSGGGGSLKKGRRRSGSREERETTPPSYDKLFPKSSLADADVLP